MKYFSHPACRTISPPSPAAAAAAVGEKNKSSFLSTLQNSLAMLSEKKFKNNYFSLFLLQPPIKLGKRKKSLSN